MSRGPEAQLQKAVKQVYALAGAVLYDLSQGYRPDPGGTRQTPGLPDLWGFLPRLVSAEQSVTGADVFLSGATCFWHEVKTPAGLVEHEKLRSLTASEVKKSQVKNWKRAVAQAEFRFYCEARRIPYAMGGVDEAKELLVKVGLAYRDNYGVIFIGKRRAA